MRKPLLALAGLCALLVLGLSACGGGGSSSSSSSTSSSDEAAGETIEVGTSMPLSGPIAAACKPYNDGALAWFDKVNGEGGVDGSEIEDKVLDDAYTAPQALANARQFAEEDVLAFFNGCGTIQPPAMQPVARQAGIPYLFPFGTEAEMLNPVQENLFALLPLYSQQGEGLVRAAFEKEGPGSVYLFNFEVPGSEETTKAVEAAVEEDGGTMAGVSSQAPGAPDFTPEVLKMKAAHPDYVLLIETTADAVRIIQTIEEQHAEPTKSYLTSSAEANSEFLGPIGKQVEGKVLLASPVLPESGPEAKECDAAFEANKVKPSIGALWGCGVAQALVSVIEDAGPEVSHESVIEALGEWNEREASEVMPPMTFTPDDHLGVSTMTLLGIKGGQFTDEGELDVK